MSCPEPSPPVARPAAEIFGGPTLRLRLELAYDGTDFHGWAAQRGMRTVEGVLTDALRLITQAPVSLTVAGRTDAGVHASAQTAHVDVPTAFLAQRSMGGDPSNLVRRLARLLPADVRVMQATEVTSDFDARFSALRRHYVYRVTACPWGALPTRARDTAVWSRPVDFSRLQQAAAPLVGEHDFAAFCKAKDNATTVRTLERFEWAEVSSAAEPHTFEAHLSADAFCWNMVRSLVGACLQVASGMQPLSLTSDALALRSRAQGIKVAPGKGLTFAGVDYPPPAQWASQASKARRVRTLPGEEFRAAGIGNPETNPHYHAD